MIDNKILIIIAALIMIICILTGFIIATQTIPHETHPAANTTKNITKNKTHSNTTVNATLTNDNTESSSTGETQTKNSTEGEYGGFTKEEAIYREGLVDGHRQAEEALLNDRGIDASTADTSDSGSSNVETTTDSGSSSDSGSSNVESLSDSENSNFALV